MKPDRRQPRSMVVVYQPSRDGEAALAYALEIAQAASATLTVTSVAPQGEPTPDAPTAGPARPGGTRSCASCPRTTLAGRPVCRRRSGRPCAYMAAGVLGGLLTARDRPTAIVKAGFEVEDQRRMCIDPVPITFAVGSHAIGRTRRW